MGFLSKLIPYIIASTHINVLISNFTSLIHYPLISSCSSHFRSPLSPLLFSTRSPPLAFVTLIVVPGFLASGGVTILSGGLVMTDGLTIPADGISVHGRLSIASLSLSLS